jgi:hypothetical protein
MTAEDRNEVRTSIGEGIERALAPFKAEPLAHTDAPIQAAVASGKAHTEAPIPTFRDAAREMLTEWQRALERISLEYSHRFDAIDTAQAKTITRLGLVEERLLAVELRIPPQPPRQ